MMLIFRYAGYTTTIPGSIVGNKGQTHPFIHMSLIHGLMTQVSFRYSVR